MVDKRMHEAKSLLSRLVKWARNEEEARRQPGGLEGRIEIGPDFDDEDEEIIAAFEDRERCSAAALCDRRDRGVDLVAGVEEVDG